ncbi:putative quinol monooxygenase [Haladaptatus sp. NG-WS-4]
MLIVHTSIPIKSEYRAKAIKAAESLAGQSRNEDGTVRYRAMVDVENPNVLRFFEQYEDVVALEAHVETDHYRKFENELPKLVNGELETIRVRVDDSETIRFDVDELRHESRAE